MLKIIFLDIDGVLNNDFTKEKVPGPNHQDEFDGLDFHLLKMYLDWFNQRDYVNVLSSSWRIPTAFFDFKKHLQENGLSWIGETPYFKGIGRGHEIQAYFLNNTPAEPAKYIILDDMGPSEFLKHQRSRLVQTSAHKGLEPKKLALVDKLMGWSDGAGETSSGEASS